MQVKLKVLTGSHAGKEIPITVDQYLIGRSDKCQLRPKSESVSRRHCVIAIRNGRVLIQDLKSRNGTFVNGKQLPTDKAKVVKPGDHLRIGKLEFEAVIEVGLGGAKRPEVKDVSEAAERTVQKAASGGDSRFEDVDIGAWLEEADQLDRVRKQSDPETRQLRLDETQHAVGGSDDSSELSTGTGELNDGDSKEKSAKSRPQKAKPGKLPAHLKSQSSSGDSREAAGDALKRFFSGR